MFWFFLFHSWSIFRRWCFLSYFLPKVICPVSPSASDLSTFGTSAPIESNKQHHIRSHKASSFLDIPNPCITESVPFLRVGCNLDCEHIISNLSQCSSWAVCVYYVTRYWKPKVWHSYVKCFLWILGLYCKYKLNCPGIVFTYRPLNTLCSASNNSI